MDDKQQILNVKSLKKYFPIKVGLLRKVIGHVKAVDNISFFINKGETLGLVGESGCGKTTLGRTILKAIEPTSGEIIFRTKNNQLIDLNKLDRSEMRPLRTELQMVFQDPYSSLDARMTVLDIISEPLKINNLASGVKLEEEVKELARIVGLNVTHLKRYPHAFSGGQRQRIGIARALATDPHLIVADEPVSALDVSVQAKILNLLRNLQEERNLTYLFIAHDLSVIEHISDRVAVMYVGKFMETGITEDIFLNPAHPYTEALMSAVPKPDPHLEKHRLILPGEVANPAAPPSGCYFHPRCHYAQEVCHKNAPELTEVSVGHFSACHFAGELDLKGVSSESEYVIN